jgi:hypothetical protein
MFKTESLLTAPNRTVEAADGVTYAYRRLGDASSAPRGPEFDLTFQRFGGCHARHGCRKRAYGRSSWVSQ